MANNIYQYSVLSALMQGLAHAGPTAQQILTHGDHGLGTVSHMNGEIIIVDGEIYHFTAHNQLRKVDATEIFPFLMITQFRPTLTKHLPTLTLSTIPAALAPLLPSHQNSFLSVRIDAFFDQVAFRVIPGQSDAKEWLVDLAKRQQHHSVHRLRGVLFGFWSPSFSNGFSIAGFHLHFLAADRSAGGHVTGFEARDVTLSAAVVQEYRVELPQDGAFHESPIRHFGEDLLHAAEGSR
ncbi:alpha-acetolactate decarboxylase [Aspergillus coremiiformis]|uniref:Alpha-acetolactate decarboxylase n=1 Tax=Aspergillus coremiiformis TaxID=138285 RepID=A0A5N6ZEK9_9EURO|nr:alpha-acetolactate decarboxylase [Aspergillus coremiiformis]